MKRPACSEDDNEPAVAASEGHEKGVVFWMWSNFTALLYFSGENPVNPGIRTMGMRQGMKMEWCGAKGDLCYGNGAEEMWPWEQETTFFSSSSLQHLECSHGN